MASLGEAYVELGIRDRQLLQGLGRVERRLDQYNRRFQAVARRAQVATAALAGSITLLTNRAAQYADQIENITAQTGVAVEELQALGFAAKQSGTNMDTLSSALRSMGRRAAEAAQGNTQHLDSFRRLGVEVTRADGSMRDTYDIMVDIADATATMGSEAEVSAALMRTMGDSGRRLAPFMMQGAGGIEELTDRARELGIVTDEDGIRALSALSSQTDMLQAQFGALGRQIALNFIGPLHVVNRWVSEVVSRLSEMDSETQTTMTRVVMFGGALLAGVSALGVMASAAMLALRGISLLGTVVGVVTSPVTMGVAAIATGAYLLYRAWDENWLGIRDLVVGVWEDWLQPTFELIGGWLEDPWEWAIDTGGDVWEWLTETTWIEKIEDVRDLLVDAWDWVIDTAGNAWDWLRDTAAWGYLEAAWDILQDGWEWLIDTAGDVWGWLRDTDWLDVISAAEGYLADAWQWVVGTGGSAWDWFMDTALVQWLTNLSETLTDSDMWRWVVQVVWPEAGERVEAWWEDVRKVWEQEDETVLTKTVQTLDITFQHITTNLQEVFERSILGELSSAWDEFWRDITGRSPEEWGERWHDDFLVPFLQFFGGDAAPEAELDPGTRVPDVDVPGLPRQLDPAFRASAADKTYQRFMPGGIEPTPITAEDVWERIWQTLDMAGIEDELANNLAAMMGAAFAAEGAFEAKSLLGQFPGGQEQWLEGTEDEILADLEDFVERRLPNALAERGIEVPDDDILREYWEHFSALNVILRESEADMLGSAESIAKISESWADAALHAKNANLPGNWLAIFEAIQTDIPGFKGGTPWTGGGNPNDIAGFVHQREAVIPWESLQRGPEGVLSFLGMSGFRDGRLTPGVGGGMPAAASPTGFEALTDTLMGLLENVLGEDLLNTVTGVIDAMTGGFRELWDSVGEIEEVTAALQQELDNIEDGMEGTTQEWGHLIDQGIMAFRDGLREADGFLADFADGAADMMQGVLDFSDGITMDMQQLFANAATVLANAVGSILSALFGGIETEFDHMTARGQDPFPDLDEMIGQVEQWEDNRERLRDLQRRQQTGEAVGGGLGAGAGAGLGFAIGGPVGGLIGGALGFLGGRSAGRAATAGHEQEIQELQEALQVTSQELRDLVGIAMQDLASGIQGAFTQADTWEDFADNLGQAVERQLRDAMLTAFMSSEAVRPLLEQMSDVMEDIVIGGQLDRMEELEDLVDETEGVFKELWDVFEELGLHTKDTAESMADTAATMRNVPSGFKVALERFDAADPVRRPRTGGYTPRDQVASDWEHVDGPASAALRAQGQEVHIHGDVYGYDDFRAKVAQAESDNNRRSSLSEHGLGRRAR